MSSWRDIVEAEDVTVAILRRLYLDNRSAPGFLAEVAGLFGTLDEVAACGALWILKTAAQDGVLGANEVDIVARNLETSRHWAARLLLCQLFAHVECPASERETAVEFYLKCFDDRRVIIRAWALSAMWPLRRDPRFRTDIQRCLRAARRDPGKAMQARLRHLK